MPFDFAFIVLKSHCHDGAFARCWYAFKANVSSLVSYNEEDIFHRHMHDYQCLPGDSLNTNAREFGKPYLGQRARFSYGFNANVHEFIK